MARTTKIPTYDRQVAMSDQGVRGLSGGEIAQASDTGLQSFGRGVSNLGGNLAAIEKDRMRKEATLWVSENYEDLHQKYVKKEEELQNEDQTLDGKGFVTKSLNEFQKLADDKLKSAPSKMAGESWKQQMNQYKMSAFNSAIKYESSKRLKYQQESLTKTGNGMALRFAEDPTLWDSITQSFDQVLNGLKDSPETEAIEGYSNLWNKTTLLAAKEKGLAYIAETGIKAIIDEGDKGKLEFIKKQMDKGVYDKILDADKLLALKNKANGVINQVTAADKAKFGIKLNDNVANIMENGTPVHEVSEAEFDYYYGKGNAQWVEYQEKLKISNGVYSSVTALTGMNLSEQAKYIENLPSTTAVEKEVKKEAIAQQAKMVKLMDDDPVMYAAKFRKDIYKKINSDDRAVVQEGLFELSQMQKGFGKQESDIVYLSDNQRNSIISTLTNANNADKETIQVIMTNYRELYGDYFDNIMAELVIKGKMDSSLAAAMMYVDDTHNFGEIFQAARMKVDNNAIAEADKSTIKSQIQSEFIPIRQSLTRHNTAAIPMVDGWQNLISKMVTVRVAKGEDVNDAITSVMNRFINDKFMVTENFIIPKSVNAGNYSESAIESATKSVIQNLKDSDIQVLMSGNPMMDKVGLDPKVGNYASIQKGALETNTAWRNTADGSGIELVWSLGERGTYPVYQMDGESGRSTVVLTWENLDTIMSVLKFQAIDNSDKELPMVP